MAKYCCFNCPEAGHDDTRELDIECPKCGHKYGFPLEYKPEKIGKYNIVEPISRGFYGAVYRVNNPILNKDFVLKVIPKAIYNLHKKDFYKEVQEHSDLAKKSNHIVNISDAFDDTIEFTNGLKVECHVALLDYIPGPTLKKILTSDDRISATKIAQLSIDLLSILQVLRQKQKNHNDLHAENIIVESLPHNERRAGEIEETLRVVAIDIGSLTSENKEGDSPDRQSDVHWVAEYLIQLSEKLLRDPEHVSDLNYRLASLLEDRAKLFFPSAEHTRQPNYDEIIRSIESCFLMQVHPWEEPFRLLNFNDTYNAQTLDPWFVPSLLVDPDDQWLERISGKGPLVITGMRGCGKTMMLRALQFHARAANAKLKFPSDKSEQLAQIKEEKYVGIYVSCNKLLDRMGTAAEAPLHQPYSKLFIRYGIEAIKALRHLKSIDEKAIKFDYYKDFIDLFKNHISNSQEITEVNSELKLEQKLLDMIYSLNRGEDKYIVTANPSNAFPALADAIKKSSIIWNNSYILFLLDDVSTRYLGVENINNLLSALIFQSEECAFKFTSEVQTIELALYSPGKIEKAKKGRDFESFDLGSAVNDKIRNKGGKKFVIEILERRAKGNRKHPQEHPAELLGSATLHDIASSIYNRADDKTIKKRIYHGITALAGVCIGDIGDMISLYDLIIRHYDPEKQTIPIPAEQQNECFQDLCSTRLYEINRRGSNYKDFAISFAEAAYELLMKTPKNAPRIRQYYSIYIRINTGDTETQYEKIRQLLDAGIFIYTGSANTPRTLGNDTNPISQFKLTYRKLYGLSNLIGLTNGDRFELSGKDTEEWLNNPSKGKEILMKNVGGAGSKVDEADLLDEEKVPFETLKNITTSKKKKAGTNSTVQKKLSFDVGPDYYENDKVQKLIADKTPKCNEVSFDMLKNEKFDYLIAALGFEDRTLASIRNLIQLDIKKVLLVKYSEEGKAAEIIELLNRENILYELIEYENVKTSFHIPEGNVLCDITGMSKSVIFNIIRNSLSNNCKVFVSHVFAEHYYPLNSDINTELMNVTSEDEDYDVLNTISDKVYKGEITESKDGAYEIYNLLLSDTDDSKRNILLGFCSAKYERLFQVLENRQFDKIQIVTSNNDSPRAKLAKLATRAAVNTYQYTDVEELNPNSITDTLNFLTLTYQKYYIDQNFNFEICLTGSKRQTVACAAISAAFKISDCWYVKPHTWDVEHFSKGVGTSAYFIIEM